MTSYITRWSPTRSRWKVSSVPLIDFTRFRKPHRNGVGSELAEVARDQRQSAEGGEVELLPAGSRGILIALHPRGEVSDGIDGVAWTQKA